MNADDNQLQNASRSDIFMLLHDPPLGCDSFFVFRYSLSFIIQLTLRERFVHLDTFAPFICGLEQSTRNLM